MTDDKVVPVSPLNEELKLNVDWQGLETELRHVVNMFNLDAATNTPDFILAKDLVSHMRAWVRLTKDRDKWHETGAVAS